MSGLRRQQGASPDRRRVRGGARADGRRVQATGARERRLYGPTLEEMTARLPDRLPPNPHPAPHPDNRFVRTKPSKRHEAVCPRCGKGEG